MSKVRTPTRSAYALSKAVRPADRLRLVIWVFWTALCFPGTAWAHPQDGPHGDLRVQITDGGVRFDMVMNLCFVDGLVRVARESRDTIDASEEEPLRQALLGYFTGDAKAGGTAAFAGAGGGAARHNEVTIDGVAVSPRQISFEVLRPGPELIPLFPVTGLWGATRVHLIVEYPAKSAPKTVSMLWGTFPDAAALVGPDAAQAFALEAAMTAESVVKIIRFTPEEPQVIWHATGVTPEQRFQAVPAPARTKVARVPGVSLAIGAGAMLGALGLLARRGLARAALPAALVLALGVGGGVLARHVGVVEVADPFAPKVTLPSEAEALAAFGPLHANIYRAFDYATESQIYDALARSVDGQLLDSLYNEVYRGLILQEEGGAVCQVEKVTPIETNVLSIGVLPGEVPGFRVFARWRVLGTVYHWGHSHSRLNEYAAEYSVASSGAGWRISGSRTLEQFRVDSEPGAPDEPSADPRKDL